MNKAVPPSLPTNITVGPKPPLLRKKSTPIIAIVLFLALLLLLFFGGLTLWLVVKHGKGNGHQPVTGAFGWTLGESLETTKYKIEEREGYKSISYMAYDDPSIAPLIPHAM
jgi:hypothetical protein